MSGALVYRAQSAYGVAYLLPTRCSVSCATMTGEQMHPTYQLSSSPAPWVRPLQSTSLRPVRSQARSEGLPASLPPLAG